MTKAKFIAFEEVRLSGLTNMFDIKAVQAGALKYGQTLSNSDCFKIMLNYDKYFKKYLQYGKKNSK
jgi:hypothetical protein